MSWKKIPCSKKHLQLSLTLSGGQSFRWRKSDDDTWTGVFNNIVWILSQTDDHLLYKTYKNDEKNSENPRKRKLMSKDSKSEEELLKSYFRLDIDLDSYYGIWADSDENFKKSVDKFYGIRILNQNVTENLFSFICSSNNNIIRISSMVEKLCKMYGTPIAEVDNQQYYSFPEIARLTAPSVESELRTAGFGYRAKFIQQSACLIEEFGGETWLDKLKTLPYSEAKSELMKLSGIGAKVADCICLMSLGHLEAIPVDTHIYKVASQIYLPHLKNYKSVTDKVYNEIGDYFRNLYGDYAGWAHTVLFCSDLKMFQENDVKKKKEQIKNRKKKLNLKI